MKFNVFVQAYLQRIQVQPGEHNGLDFLSELMRRHVRAIPFENLDILRKVPLSLELDALFDKLVVRKRGGVCYEINRSLHHLLRELGYEVEYLAATTFREGEWNTAENTHMLNIVHLETGSYVVDAGFGGNSPGVPVPMDGTEVEDVDGAYRIMQGDNRCILQKNSGEGWQPLYRFEPKRRSLSYFEPFLRFIEQSPASPFNKKRFLSIATEQGRVTLSGNSLTQVADNVKTKSEISEQEAASVIERIFGIR